MISPFPKMTEGQKLSFSLTAGQKECCTKAFFYFKRLTGKYGEMNPEGIWWRTDAKNFQVSVWEIIIFRFSPASFSHILMLTNRAT